MDLFCILIAFSLYVAGIYGIEYNTWPKQLVRFTTNTPHVADKTCLLVPEPGPCRSEYTTYYFDPATMTCSTFKWGGCQGNGNRFDTFEECMDTCISKPGEKSRPNWCSLGFDYGFCFGAVERWYYDRKWKTCKKTLYSGCGGNKNNFYNEEQCDSVCRFGTGPLRNHETSKNLKKILIINPLDMTTPFSQNNTPAKPIGESPTMRVSTTVSSTTPKVVTLQSNIEV